MIFVCNSNRAATVTQSSDFKRKKMNKIITFFVLSCIFQSNGLSFQGHDRQDQRVEVFPETIAATTPPSTEISLQDQRNSMRKTRLQLLGMISEKFLSWVFKDMMPEDVLRRVRRSTDDEGNEKRKDVIYNSCTTFTF